MTDAPSPLVPAERPCGSCPYRKDVPSGVWDAEEYAKLPPYDRPTGEQPARLFLCHQQTGRMCAGWVGCHPAEDLLALRVAVLTDRLTEHEYNALLDYQTPVPLFSSGREAAEHGLREVEAPSPKAQRTIAKVSRKHPGRKVRA